MYHTCCFLVFYTYVLIILSASKGKRGWKKCKIALNQQGILLERVDNSKTYTELLIPLEDGYTEKIESVKHMNSFSLTAGDGSQYLLETG